MLSTAATADPGADNPTSYAPSEASLTDIPTYLTDRAAVSADGLRTNGQDYDHYCVADHQAISIIQPGVAANVPMQVNSLSNATQQAGNNGLLYMNQWFGAHPEERVWRVVWASDFPTTNSTLTLNFSDNLVPGPRGGYSMDPAVLVTQLGFIPGAAKFRSYDWSSYVLGVMNVEPYLNTPTYIPGPLIGVNTDLFTPNPDAVGRPWAPTDAAPGRTVPYEDPYYDRADNQYIPNLEYFAGHITRDGNSITIDLGDQPAGAMIVFEASATVPIGSTEAATLTANFKADYVGPNPENTVCYPVSVAWNKIDGESGDLLPGAEFTLTPVGDTALGGAVAPITMTSADGAFTADTTDGLRPGTWEIAETTAPVGYTGTAEPQQVTVSFENQSVEIEPIANTNEAPVISGGDLTVSVGDDVTPLTGLTATDKEDGDITGKIEIVDDGGFDVQKPGTYTVVVKVTDAGGKTTEYTRTITVEVKPTPTASPTISASPTATSPAAPSPTTTTPAKAMPSTGANVGGVLVIGAMLAGAGVVAMMARKRVS